MTPLWAILVAIAGTFIGSFGALFFKKGADRLKGKNMLRKTINNPPLLTGLFLYGLSTIPFMIALKHGELSIIYPAVSTQYVWVSIISVEFLGEKMGALKWSGVALILLGVVLISLAA